MKNYRKILAGEDIKEVVSDEELELEARVLTDIQGNKIEGNFDYTLVNKVNQRFMSGGTLYEPLYTKNSGDAMPISGEQLQQSAIDWTGPWDAVRVDI